MWHRLGLVLLLTVLTGCGKQKESLVAAAEGNSPASEEIAAIVADFPQLELMTMRPAEAQPPTLCGVIYDYDAPGTEGPHADGLIKVFMNEQAAEAFGEEKRSYAVGSVVVKQKLSAGGSVTGDSEPLHQTGIGGMIKRDPGYDPQHGDWEYFYTDDETPLQSGRIGNCVDCHENASDRDYVFGTWPHKPRRKS
jgi:hypothetical protein